MDTLMILACSIVWILVTMLFRILTPLTLRVELFALWILIFLLYFFLFFYIPYKKKLDTNILTSQQAYFDNKDKLDGIYVEQLKRKWTDDMVIRNKYYITMFIIWCYIPIPFYMIYLLYPTRNQFTLDNAVPISLLTLALTTLIATGFTLGVLNMVYVISALLIAFLVIIWIKYVTPKYILLAVLIGILALFIWGIFTIGVLPTLYTIIAFIVMIGVMYSIIS